MSEMKRSEIIYEEGWRETAPVINDAAPVDEVQPDTEKTAQKPQGSKPLLISIQLALCLLAALVLFLLKAMDSESYHDFMDFYHDELQKPVVSQDVFSSVDIGRLFADGFVTVQATPDETADSES